MQKQQLTTNTAVQTYNKQIFATRKSAVKCQMSNVKCARNRGFTLIELMVTLGIFLVMTGGVLSNYRGYGTNVLFANASEDVILALRQAQIFGVGVKGTNRVYTIPYGVYFSTAINQKSKVTIFGDNNSNNIFDTGELLVETASWNESISISSLMCDGATCGSNVWVTFRRPSSNALIVNTADQVTPFNELTVAISDSVTGKTSTVTVTSAGQISLQ